MTEIDQPNQTPPDLAPLSEWLVEQMRLTAFLDPQSEIDYSSWWLDVVREPPDARVDKPKTGKHTEQGLISVEGQKLILETQPGRVDWRLGISEPDISLDVMPNIGFLPDVRQTFCELMSRWFEIDDLPQILRLALGAILLYPVEDRPAGYRMLTSYIPIPLDPANSSDLMYQINRCRASNTGIPELMINRLSRWSVARSILADFTLDSTGPRAASRPTHFACRLQLDINTVPGSPNILPGQQISQIFRELIQLGEEIVLKGDIP